MEHSINWPTSTINLKLHSFMTMSDLDLETQLLRIQVQNHSLSWFHLRLIRFIQMHSYSISMRSIKLSIHIQIWLERLELCSRLLKRLIRWSTDTLNSRSFQKEKEDSMIFIDFWLRQKLIDNSTCAFCSRMIWKRISFQNQSSNSWALIAFSLDLKHLISLEL